MIATTTAGGTQQNTGGKQPTPALIPFIRATRPHREKFLDRTVASLAADQDLGSIDIPAYGYARSILIQVSTTVALAGAGHTYHEDAPFNILKNIFVSEPNGAQIHQFVSGFDLAMVNKYGGIRRVGDPRQNPVYLNTLAAAGGNVVMQYRIPFEIDERDGLGSLPNQNAAAMFKLRMTLASSADWITARAIGVQPTFRIEGWLEAWDQPQASSPLGPQQQTPPGLGTTQYWSQQVYNVNAGLNTIRLNRVGNYFRNLLLIYRTTVGGRSTAVTGGEALMPDPWAVMLDTLNMDNIAANVWRAQIWERYGLGVAAIDTAGGRDSAVYPYDFCHEFDGHVGLENRDQWLNTLASSRFEFQFTAAAGGAGTLTVLTNDVSPVGQIFL